MNTYMDQVELKYIGNNPIKKLISQHKYNKYISRLRKQSHSIGSLWFFADFVKLAERVYFYNNKKDSPNGVYSSNSYHTGENGFIITATDKDVVINCKLYSDTQKVILEAKRLNGTNKITELEFNGSSPLKTDDYDEVLIDNIIGIINRYIIKVLNFCWYSKGSFDVDSLKYI